MPATSKLNPFLGLFFLAVWITGCTLGDISSADTGTSGGEDLEAAGSILGESLSSDESGIILSLNDALTTISESRFINQSFKALSADRSGRGSETNYRHSYRQQTGIHAISFKRQVKDALFSKTVTDSMHYRYRSSDGANIKSPQQNQNNIRSIYFDGRHEGQISTLQKQSAFVRQDTFIIRGVNTPELSVDGVHHAQGSIQIGSQNQGSYQRNYKLEINLLDFTAPKLAFNNGRDFWQNMSGTLSWQLYLNNEPNGGSSDKKMGGTIKLAGNGIALLNFRRSPKKLQVNLDNGDVKDQDKEFEGRVASVNIVNLSISLKNGRTLYLAPETKIEDEDFTTLEAVEQAVTGGVEVWAEGEGGIKNNQFIITEVEFEREDEEDDSENDTGGDEEQEIEFEGGVSSVDAEAGIFILAGKVSVRINSPADIDSDGDYQTLQAVADALGEGVSIEAEGEATQNSEGASVDLTAIQVEFEKVESDDNDDDDED